MHPQDTSFLVNGFKPTVAAADPRDVIAFKTNQALGAQKLQEGSMDLQQKQIEMRDQENLRQNYMQSGGDMDKFQQLNMQNGVSPKAIMGVQQQVLAMKEAKAKLSTAELGNQSLKNDQLNALLAPVAAEPDPAKQAVLWDQQNKIGVQSGVMTAAEAAQHPYPGSPQAVAGYVAHLNTDKWITAGAAASRAASAAQTAATGATKETREAATAAAEDARKAALAAPTLDKAKSEAIAAANTAVTGAPNPQGLTPAAAQEAKDRAATLANTSANEKVQRAQGWADIALKQKTFDNQFGSASTTAKSIVNGDLDPATVRSMLRKNPGLMAQAKAIDPNFDEATIDSRYATLREFNSTNVGKAGGQVLALNTLVHHAELYQQAGEALKNKSFTPGNAAYNAVSKMMGAPAPQNADLVARFLAGETGKVATGGVPAESEIHGILDNLRTKNGPQQIADAGKTLMQVAAGRFTPLMELAKKNKLDNVVQVLGPDAREILQRRGFDPNTMKPTAAVGAGGIPTPTSQKDYDALPKGSKFLKPGDQTVYTKQ